MGPPASAAHRLQAIAQQRLLLLAQGRVRRIASGGGQLFRGPAEEVHQQAAVETDAVVATQLTGNGKTQEGQKRPTQGGVLQVIADELPLLAQQLRTQAIKLEGPRDAAHGGLDRGVEAGKLALGTGRGNGGNVWHEATPGNEVAGSLEGSH